MPVIVAASILTAYDAPMLPIVKVGPLPGEEKNGVKLYRAIGSLPIITLLMDTAPKNYYKALWGPCTTTSIWIGSLSYNDPLEDLLRIFELTGFGDARVDAQGLTPALLTLGEVVALYRETRLECGLKARDIASKTIFVDPDMALMDSMKLMSEKRVRRLFLHGEEGAFVSDRNILAYLFSPKELKVVRDDPEHWTDLKLSTIQQMKAYPVAPEAAVEDVGKMLEVGRDVFMLENGSSIISRWDLIMKPWKLGKLRIPPGMSVWQGREPER